MLNRFVLSLIALFAPLPAFAAAPHPWGINFQEAATPVMEKLHNMHEFLLIIITVISLFVLAVLSYVVVRFRRKANPVPSNTTHNTLLEIVWTAIPIMILVAIAIPSLKLHYYMESAQVLENPDSKPFMTLKVTGRQWYWEYEYPEQGITTYESRMKPKAELKPGEPRLLAVDNPVVVPVNKVILVHVTGGDVIHSWAMPAFGVKSDAIPGKLNETWFKATKTGTFYGQCSELCGVEHGFMPIQINVVSEEEFNAWVQSKKQSADASSASPIELSHAQ